MRLRCEDLVVRPGDAVVLRGLSLEIADGARTALVGPSGAGKTTLLRAISGLTPLQGGRIFLGDRQIDTLAPHRRRCSVVFQEPRLLPHLDLVDNVAFPLRASGVGKATRRARARELLEEVGLAGLGQRGVGGLSGGEQQRVALARALIADPELLMLDEPLAAVDPGRRGGLRRLIGSVQEQRRLTTMLITHDRAEAAELGEQLALLLEGQVVQHDAPAAFFDRPAAPAVARFFGANVLRGVVRDGLLTLGDDRLPVPGPDGDAALSVRPERLMVGEDGPLRLTVTEAIYAGTHVRLTLRHGDLTLHAHCPPATAPAAGAAVRVAMSQDDLWRMDGDAPALRGSS